MAILTLLLLLLVLLPSSAYSCTNSLAIFPAKNTHFAHAFCRRARPLGSVFFLLLNHDELIRWGEKTVILLTGEVSLITSGAVILPHLIINLMTNFMF